MSNDESNLIRFRDAVANRIYADRLNYKHKEGDPSEDDKIAMQSYKRADILVKEKLKTQKAFVKDIRDFMAFDNY